MARKGTTRKKTAATESVTVVNVPAAAPIVAAAPAPAKRRAPARRKAALAAPARAPRSRAGVAQYRRYGGAAVGYARSAGEKILGVSKNQLIAVGSAAGLAFLQKQGVQVPKLISSLSVPANAGILAWGAARLFKSETLDHIATGMLCAGAYAFASGAPIQGDDSVVGHGSAVVYDDVEGDDYED